jgi:phage-related protein
MPADGFTDSTSIKYARSTDGGDSFPTTGEVAYLVPDLSVPLNSQSPAGFRWSGAVPQVAADPVEDGVVYVVWIERRAASNNGTTAVYLKRGSTDETTGTITWSNPVAVYSGAAANDYEFMPSVFVSRDRVVHVTFSARSPGYGNDSFINTYYVQSSDLGQTFTAPFPLDSTYVATGFMGDYQISSGGGYETASNGYQTEAILTTWTKSTNGQGDTENRWGSFGSFCSIVFTDVPPGSTFYPYVRCLGCKSVPPRNIISGYPCGGTDPAAGIPEPCDGGSNKYFRPHGLITRGQISKMVSEAAGITDSPGGQLYEDVPDSSPFYIWINRLSNRGVMSGYPCGQKEDGTEPCRSGMPYFRPNANATRGQLSKIVSNTAGYSEDHTEQTYEDVPNYNQFYTWIQRLSGRGVIGGYPCGSAPDIPCIDPDRRSYFRPFWEVTRGQGAKIISNTFFPECEAVGKKSQASSAPNAPEAVSTHIPQAPAAVPSSQATPPATTPDPDPKGNHDNTTPNIVEGWACDPSNFSKPVSVHIYDGWGFEPNNGNFLGAVLASVTRYDVASTCGGHAKHGFTFTLPANRKDGKALKDGRVHTIVAHIIGIDAQGNSNGRVVQMSNTGHLELLGTPRNGLLGEYFSGTGLTTLAYRGYDADVNFNWYHASPDASLPVDSYSVRWTGYIKTPDGVSGSYNFFTVSDDGVRLWVNGQLLVNNWTNHAPTENSKIISLQGGQVYSIKLEYYEAGGTALIQMLWQPPNGAKEIIPSSKLLPAGEPVGTYGLKGEYFNGKTLTDLRLTRYDNNVDYDWGNWYPDPVLPVDSFSVRWTGSLRIPAGAGGSYRFYTVADDGVRLWVNGQLIISDWTTHGPVENMSSLVQLEAGKTYDIKLEYYEDWGGAMVQLLWQPPGGVKAIIPATNLYPGPTCQPVSWASLVNVTATGTGNSIKKTSGAEWVWDASSVSIQQIASGDGYVQVTLNGNDPSRKHFGLGIGNSSASYDDIDFSFAVQNDAVWIWENNQEKVTLGNKPVGTTLKVAVEGGVVKYYVNNTVVYTSLKAPTYPLILDTSIANLNGQSTEATICRNGAVTTAGGFSMNSTSDLGNMNNSSSLERVAGQDVLGGVARAAPDMTGTKSNDVRATNYLGDSHVSSQMVTNTMMPSGTGTPTTYDHKGKPGYANPASLNSERGFRKDKDKDKDASATVSPTANVSLTATSVSGPSAEPNTETATPTSTATPGRAAVTTTATPSPEVTATPNITADTVGVGDIDNLASAADGSNAVYYGQVGKVAKVDEVDNVHPTLLANSRRGSIGQSTGSINLGYFRRASPFYSDIEWEQRECGSRLPYKT